MLAVPGSLEGTFGRRPGHRAERLPGHEPPGQLAVFGPAAQSGQGDQLGDQRHGGGVPADFFEQHRGLDPTEAESAFRLRHGDGRPSLVDHPLPQRPVVGLAGRQVRTDPFRARLIVEQLPCRVLQRALIGRKIEVHGWIV